MQGTGIWTPEEAEIYHRFDVTLAEKITKCYQPPKRVIDLGCGKGDYCKFFESEGWKNLEGYEGTIGLKDAFRNIAPVDLSRACEFRKADFVLSLEVGEHIPEQYESIFFTNLTSPCTKHLVLSWALPDQGGPGHVNGRTNDYVIARVKEKGLRLDPIKTRNLREGASLPWFKNTLMAFEVDL